MEQERDEESQQIDAKHSERAELAERLGAQLRSLEEFGWQREALETRYNDLLRQERVFHAKPRSLLSTSARPVEDLDELNERTLELQRVEAAKAKLETAMRTAWSAVRASAAAFGVSLAGDLPSGPLAGIRAAIRSAGCPLPSGDTRGRNAA